VHNTKPLYWERARLIFGSSLPARDKYTLLAISDHLGSNAQCWPSVSRLELRTGQSRRTVIRALDALEQSGALLVTRATGSSNRYSIDLAWLQAHQLVSESHQCQSDTSANVTPVPESHPNQCQSDTGGVPQWHGGSATVTPKGVQEGEQGRSSRKDTNRSNRALSLDDVKAIDIPQELADALPGYRDAFNAWLPVRPGTAWRQKTMQVVRFHNKMLKAHKDGKDVLDALGKALDNGWKGLDASYMVDMPRQRANKEAPALIDYKAQYLAQLTGGLK
jgi:hypothetical protein